MNIKKNQTGDTVISHLTNRTEDMALRWPSEEDLNGAAVALTRLQVDCKHLH